MIVTGAAGGSCFDCLMLVAVGLVASAFVLRWPDFTVAWFACGVALVFSLWLLLELGFFSGARGPNRYGADPLGQMQATPGSSP